jgi:uncharacterized cysteine cluster protein YcgN (CxxCxxCC family)
MVKWFTGVSAAIILAISGWAWMFVLMGYQAQADITELKKFTSHLNKDNSELKAEIRSVKSISERTEKNTEQIRDYLLNRAIK